MITRFATSFVVVAFVGLLAYGLLDTRDHGLGVGDPAPAVKLPKLEGSGEGSLASYRGRWVLVNFWASWCPPCREEAPALEEFQKQHGNVAFTMLGIDSGDASDDGRAFVDRYGISYPQLHDGPGRAADDFGTSGFPESFLIDPKGRLQKMWKGPITLDDLNSEVVPLLQPRNPNDSMQHGDAASRSKSLRGRAFKSVPITGRSQHRPVYDD